MTAVTATSAQTESGAWRAALPHIAPFLGIIAVALLLPVVGNDYWALIGTRMAIYWVLVSGLNLIVGFAGHLAIGVACVQHDFLQPLARLILVGDRLFLKPECEDRFAFLGKVGLPVRHITELIAHGLPAPSLVAAGP